MNENLSVVYEDLKKFIAEHPGIALAANGVSVPRDVRPEFYRYFNAMRATFIKEYFSSEAEKAFAIGDAYTNISKLVQQDMNLEAIEISGNLSEFLQDPLLSLAGALFGPLFGLLQGKITEAAFVLEAQKTVKAFFNQLFCEGYNRWGTISLLHLLGPNYLWSGTPRDLDSDPHTYTEFYPGFEDDVPELRQECRLSFAYISKASFVMPDVLVQTKRLNAYVSLKSHWYDVRWKAKVLNENLEWLDLHQLAGKFGWQRPNMTIHLARESADELKLLSDYYQMARPDMLLEFMETDDWYYSQHVKHIILKHQMFNPRLGSYVISRVDVPSEAFAPPEEVPAAQLQPLTDSTITPVTEESQQEARIATATDETRNPVAAPISSPQKAHPMDLAHLPNNIHVINAGYDTNALEPVVKALNQWLALREQQANQELSSGESLTT